MLEIRFWAKNIIISHCKISLEILVQSKGCLETPQNTQSKATVHVCNECGATYTQDKDLQLHLKGVHWGEKLLNCEVRNCPYTTTWPGALARHARGHSDERPHKCDRDQCVEAFKRKDKLKNHIASVHDNIKHDCPHCPKYYSRIDLLNSHIKAKHGN